MSSGSGSTQRLERPRAALRALAGVVLVAPLLVLPGQVDFSSLPQRAFIQAGVLAIVVLALATRQPLAVGPRRLDAPLAAFLAASTLSLLATAHRGEGWHTLGHWLACGAVYVVVSRAARPGDVQRLALALLAAAAAVALVGLAQAGFGLRALPQAVAPAATLGNRNVAAGYLAAVAPLALLGWRIKSWRPALGCGLALIAAFLPFTLSRAAALAVALQLALIAGVGWSRRDRVEAARRRRVIVPVGLAVLALAAAVALTALDAAKARAIAIRGQLVSSAVSMALERPFLGIGLGRFGAHHPGHGEVVRDLAGRAMRVESPHNEALQVLAESGVAGLLALGWLVAVTLQSLRRLLRSRSARSRTRGLAIGLSLLGLGVDAALGFPLRLAVPPLVAAVLLGMLSLLDARETRGAEAPEPRPARVGVAPALAAGLVVALALGGSLLRLAGDRALFRLRLAEEQGRRADAVLLGRTAAWADPRPTTLVALARAQLRVGRPAAAAALLEQAREAWPLDAVAIGTLGLARLALGDPRAHEAFALARALGAGPGRDVQETREPAAPGASGCAAGVSVELLASGHVNVSARTAPVTAVLRCLGDRTGVQVEYDGPPPRQTVSLDLRDAPLDTAVETLFEGLGLAFALSADPSGPPLRRVVVFATSGSPSRSTGSSPAPAPASASEEPDWSPPENDGEPTWESPAQIDTGPSVAQPEFPGGLRLPGGGFGGPGAIPDVPDLVNLTPTGG